MTKSSKSAAPKAPAKPITERAAKPASKPQAPAKADEPAKRSGKADAKPSSKQDELVTLLRRPTGATIAQLTKATGWQAHSVRGVISGTIKKKLGLNVTSERQDGERVYRIA